MAAIVLALGELAIEETDVDAGDFGDGVMVCFANITRTEEAIGGTGCDGAISLR